MPDGRGSGSTLPCGICMAPSILQRRRPLDCHCQIGLDLWYPVLSAERGPRPASIDMLVPGLPANIYSGNQASGLENLYSLG